MIPKRVVEKMVHEMQSPQHSEGYVEGWTRFVGQCIDQRGLIDKSFHDKFVDWYTDMLGEEIGRIEKNIRADLSLKQDTEAAALRIELATLRSQVAELVDIVTGLATDVAELQAHGIDRGKVRPQLRITNAA